MVLAQLWGSSRPLNGPIDPTSLPPARLKDRTLERIRNVAHILRLELCLSFSALCCIRSLLEILLLPLKVIVNFGRISLRDCVSLFLVGAAIVPFIIVTEKSPMYLYSHWYHLIRSTALIKLYVLFGMLEVGEKLLSSFNHDAAEAFWVALQRHFGATSSKDKPNVMLTMWLACIAACGCALQSFTLLLSIVTLNASLNCDDYSIFALLLSSNFKELKGQVFKKCNPSLLFQQVCFDAVERVQLFVFAAVMLLRHAQSEGFGTVEAGDLVVIFLFELLVDYVKHFFIARFNKIDLGVYKEYLDFLKWDAARTFWLPELVDRVLGKIDGFAGPTLSRPSSKATSGSSLLYTPAPAPPPPLTDLTARHLAEMTTPVSRKLPAEARQMALLKCVMMPNTLVANPARRLGFTPYAYVAILVWALGNLVVDIPRASWWMAACCLACFVACQYLIAVTVDGIAARFVVRSSYWDQLAAHHHHSNSNPDSVRNAPADCGEGAAADHTAPAEWKKTRHAAPAPLMLSATPRLGRIQRRRSGGADDVTPTDPASPLQPAQPFSRPFPVKLETAAETEAAPRVQTPVHIRQPSASSQGGGLGHSLNSSTGGDSPGRPRQHAAAAALTTERTPVRRPPRQEVAPRNLPDFLEGSDRGLGDAFDYLERINPFQSVDAK